jgi:hypothetical protein
MMRIVTMMMMMINVLFYMSITRETSSCTSRKGGWLMKSLSLKMSRDETRKTKFKFTKSAEKFMFLTTRTRTMMMMRTSLPPLLLKRLRFLNRFCSSFFSSSSLLLLSSVLLLLLLRAVVGVFPSSSAFSFAVSLPSRVSVFYAKSRTLLKREKKRVSQKFSLLSFFLSLETRARMRVRSGW